MKVDSVAPGQANSLNGKQNAGNPKTALVDSEITKDEAYNIQISDKVKEMMSVSSEEEAIRLDKVAAIREQLAMGNYNISGKDVADKILKALKS
jgi:flagellar biosynthesis anti-sigma factor FlgM